MVIEEWHYFVKTKNVNILDNILSKDVIFYSPAVHTPQIGLKITKKYLITAAEILFKGKFRYTSEIKGENIAFCEFEGHIDDIYINGVDIIEWNKLSKITSFKVLVRPLKGLLILKEKMAEKL
tara:strand:+ start:15705 stop:16073 length:369 start_codon:yes stop_codon:yes gene_type:complete